MNKKAEKYKIIKEIIRETLLKDEQMYKGVVEFMKGVEWKEDNQNQNKHKIKLDYDILTINDLKETQKEIEKN